MDRRTLLALVLTAIVIVATPIIFPGTRTPRPVGMDSTRVDTVADTTVAPTPSVTRAEPAPPALTPAPSRTASAGGVMAATDTLSVVTTDVRYDFVSRGAVPARVMLPAYRALTPGAPDSNGLELVGGGERLLHLRLATGGDTVALDTMAFSGERRREGTAVVATFRSVASAVPVVLTYRVPDDSFVVSLKGTVGLPAQSGVAATLLVTLPSRLHSHEADTLSDIRHLAIGYKKAGRDPESVSFRDLDAGQTRVDSGAFNWIAERNTYFVVAAIAPDSAMPFRSVYLRGAPRTGSEATNAYATAALPLRDNTFDLRLYAGPQSWNHLRHAATGFENVNPYGGWLHGVVQPFTTIVMRLLLWMRATFAVSYGWVLVIFGVLVRLLLWPLNQNAMRSSMRMQRIQPQLTELQAKYRNDPERQREVMMKLYAEHGMSPFTPVLGCLPMLLPMPILFALYFVFQNTIELRGVSFLWLPDLALRDPYYITPLFMGVSMFLLSWIGMRGMPPNPQSKMMSYVMPVMFTVIFWKFASGLNLYYAVQNVAALPQQWLLSRERASGAVPSAGKRGPPAPAGGGRRKGT